MDSEIIRDLFESFGQERGTGFEINIRNYSSLPIALPIPDFSKWV